MEEPLPRGGTIRKLWISEPDLYRDHLLRLDPESRRNRFSGGVSEQFMRDYAELAFGIDSIIHGFFVDGTLRGAAELRTIGAAVNREGEAAFSIEKPWQSHGVGSMLLERKYDAELSFDFGSVVGEVTAPRPTLISLMREMVADGHGFATAMFDVQARLLAG